MAFLIIAVILLIVDRTRLVSQNSELITNPSEKHSNSIAVLPFKDISAQQNQTYFSDGLAEELINTLSKISNIKVTSRTSAFALRNDSFDIPTIAKKLGVNYILEGSVRTHDSIIRVSVQLVDTKNDTYAWSQTWDKPLKNIFQIQNEISLTVAKKLQLKIAGNPQEVKQVDPVAYKLFLQSRYEFQNNEYSEGAKAAEHFLKESLQIDSTYAPSWGLLSRIYHYQNNAGVLDIDKGYPLALNAGLKAIALDSTYASVYGIMTTIAIDYEKDFKKAQELVNKGLRLEPNNPDVLESAAEVAFINDDLEKALNYHLKIVELNPLDPSSFFSLSLGYYWLGDYPAAEKALRKSGDLGLKGQIDNQLLSIILLLQGRPTEAHHAAQNETETPFRLQALAMTYYALNNKPEAAKNLQLLIDGYQENYCFQIASVYAFYKDKDKVFYWLEKGVEAKDFGLIESKTDPLFDFAKEDPRWPILMRKIGLL